ncbi:DUF3040 domain-containing protein [Nocardiopsis tropica]|uniref:DUF3040 domain-containing protein n=1 Tax=Nocardiopsis tropica TaxID=109330 RepID=A0ABU7L0M9_9ACTN|nr:DUF3040 domain-containing protein [Nocardiopsis umidischolae]MEE2055068.1 DUF3040 domain-containing protein [Nocardiopsis umidischolae]
MSLREHERRILEEIERQLREDEPDLAERLDSFGADDPDAMADSGLDGWKPWVACGLIAAVTAGLLVLLFVLTPTAPQPPPPVPAGTSETVEDTVPDSGPAGVAPAEEDPAGTGSGTVDEDPAVDEDPGR